jgi:mannose-6-phosphate isomerase-like protein (cupin superfamily)
MSGAPYRVAHVTEIVTPGSSEPGEADWRAVRKHFDIGSFGVSAYAADGAGDVLTSDHTESDTQHEELFFVASGRASLRVGDETVEAPSGTFVYVADPDVVRGATALEPETTILVVGGEPGKPYEVSMWERDSVDGG